MSGEHFGQLIDVLIGFGCGYLLRYLSENVGKPKP